MNASNNFERIGSSKYAILNRQFNPRKGNFAFLIFILIIDLELFFKIKTLKVPKTYLKYTWLKTKVVLLSTLNLP